MSIERAEQLSAAGQREVRDLAGRIAAEAGSPPLNDEGLVRLGQARPGLVHLQLRAAGSLLGYAQLADGEAELAAPAAHAPALLDAVQAEAGAALRVWTHGERSAVAPLLARRGFRQVRLLHQLRRPAGEAVPEAAVAAGIAVRPFAVGADEDAWLQVNAAAFAGHAEQGRWTRADLLAREREPWFDPAGFFLAWRESRLLGFHWTKVHPNGAGEVYVLGVDPAARGLQLGAALLAVGLEHLAGRGCPYVLLYVDGDNSAALRLYERFGFGRHDLDAQWAIE